MSRKSSHSEYLTENLGKSILGNEYENEGVAAPPAAEFSSAGARAGV